MNFTRCVISVSIDNQRKVLNDAEERIFLALGILAIQVQAVVTGKTSDAMKLWYIQPAAEWTGAQTAKTHYKADGWLAYHNTDLWRGTASVDGAKWGMWPTGGAWLCLHLWEHYLYTGDLEHLDEIRIIGESDGKETVRLDLVEFIPVGN